MKLILELANASLAVSHRKTSLEAFCFGSGVLTLAGLLSVAVGRSPRGWVGEFDAPSLRSVGQSYPCFARPV